MTLKRKITLLFASVVIGILFINNFLHYTWARNALIEAEERKLKLIAQSIAYQIKQTEKGALYVEDQIGIQLRMASIAAEYALPGRAEDVTNESLAQLSKELGIAHITLFQRNADGSDIVGVKSSDHHEIGLSSKEWGYWFTAFGQLLDREPVTVEEGQTLPHYWAGPIDVSASNPEHIDKWGYYFSGQTDYLINPYVRDETVLKYRKDFGALHLIESVNAFAEEIVEITVINPETFGMEDVSVVMNGKEFVQLSKEPIAMGTYTVIHKEDRSLVALANQERQPQTFRGEIGDKEIFKYFYPTSIEGKPYVVSISYDYDMIKMQLHEELKDLMWMSVLSVLVVIGVATVFANRMQTPIQKVLTGLQSIAGGNFGEKIDLHRRDELGQLVEGVNAVSGSLKRFTEELQASKELIEFQALHDPLTGLPNRRQMQAFLCKSIQEAEQNGTFIAVMFIDIDRFKSLNDSRGHAFGDDIIRAISDLLKDSVDTEGLVTRQGGDEFIIIVPYVEAGRVNALLERVSRRFREPLSLHGYEYYVTPSIGVSIYPEHSTHSNELIKFADTAMYAAKEQGGNTTLFYDTYMAGTEGDFEIESRLREALKGDAIDIVFQPKYDLKKEAISGAEVLVRWTDAVLGSVPPPVFIPIAEKTGLISLLWEKVMRKACAEAMEWRNAGYPIKISVNFSAVQFSTPLRLVQKVTEILDEFGMAPELFEIEITESTLMQEHSVAVLRGLRNAGITIAVDDFGTGYSSLGFLQTFPLDTLKIDRAFIKDIRASGENSEIAAAMIMLAKSLNLSVVAEGVEETAQVDYLRQKGCDEIQGYWYSKPVKAEEFWRLLQHDRLRKTV